ncbi:MAG: Gx transporter family protein [Lachnospiraceae bacterium]|nr:Gx transporter family protein [Lachnospiraceae bacterium]
MKTKKLTILALFTALAFVIHYLESMLPTLIPIPGIKPGLANIITLILLYYYGFKDSALVLITRILLVSLLFGQFLSFSYSLAGGVLCLIAEWLLLKALNKRFIPIVSALGGLTHNMAQLAVAFALTKSKGVFSYLPYLAVSGIITGAVIGLIITFLAPHLTVLLTDGQTYPKQDE